VRVLLKCLLVCVEPHSIDPSQWPHGMPRMLACVCLLLHLDCIANRFLHSHFEVKYKQHFNFYFNFFTQHIGGSPRNSSQMLVSLNTGLINMFWCCQRDYKGPLFYHALIRSPMAAAVFVNRVKEAFPVPALFFFFLRLGFECWTVCCGLAREFCCSVRWMDYWSE